MRAGALEGAGAAIGNASWCAYASLASDFDATLRAIANEGRVVVSGFTSGTIPAVRTNYLLLKNISVVGSTVNYYIKGASPLIGEAQAALYELLLAGKIDPNIMNRLPFDQFMEGIKMLEERKIVGKSVLII